MLRRQAHLQVAPANPKPKPAKELAYPSAQTERQERPACNSVYSAVGG